ncbi:hypothetical protein CQ047_17865 [Microbacterium sp. MYb72]|uniref:hypothetical protein n=1 Tax=Microbacterium sp. MYb72 TaxID=1848693 RepID=UPI000CFCAC82|nr:hypothetical protein [Microbacterium sp. MYb72]PRB02771.1 hypothetical protein CQ047_17865 [Microbacterium sp. MYb72]
MSTVKTLGPLPAPAWHRPWFRYFAPVEGAEAGTPAPPAPVPTPPPATPAPKADEPLGEKGLAALQSERDARSAAERELAAARQKLQEIEDAGKSEQQRVDDELAAKKTEIAQLTVAKTRAEIAATKGVPVELLSGTTQAEVEASADALLKFKGPAEPAAPQRYVVPDEGGKPALGKTESTRPGIGTLRAAYEENEGK